MLSQDFKEFIGLLNKHDVRYLVIGCNAGKALVAPNAPCLLKCAIAKIAAKIG